jgi:dienelactone hydrolase
LSTRREFAGGLILTAAMGPRFALADDVIVGTDVPCDFVTYFYPSGELQIEAYLFFPPGPGPFPAIVYNHGSRSDDRAEVHFVTVAEAFTAGGYAVLVPERRGYGRSQGIPYNQAVPPGTDPVPRLELEAADIDAAVASLNGHSAVDTNRVALVGWSLGGATALMAAAMGTAKIRCLVNQAGGTLIWDLWPELQEALIAAARKIPCPVFCMDSRNDKTLAAVEAVEDARATAGLPHRLKIYPPFKPSPEQLRKFPGIPPGHLLFSCDGLQAWKDDVLAFIGANLS